MSVENASPSVCVICFFSQKKSGDVNFYDMSASTWKLLKVFPLVIYVFSMDSSNQLLCHVNVSLLLVTFIKQLPTLMFLQNWISTCLVVFALINFDINFTSRDNLQWQHGTKKYDML